MRGRNYELRKTHEKKTKRREYAKENIYMIEKRERIISYIQNMEDSYHGKTDKICCLFSNCRRTFCRR